MIQTLILLFSKFKKFFIKKRLTRKYKYLGGIENIMPGEISGWVACKKKTDF